MNVAVHVSVSIAMCIWNCMYVGCVYAHMLVYLSCPNVGVNVQMLVWYSSLYVYICLFPYWKVCMCRSAYVDGYESSRMSTHKCI